jgi:hypothetical protein
MEMGKKGVEDMINEIEMFIDSCKFQAFSSDRIIVPKSELESMLNELRLKLPSEMERSKKIMRNKEGILTDARTRAEAIVTEASNEARRLVDESEIVTLANLQAEEIIRQANQDRNVIIDQANMEAMEIRLGMMEYTTGMLNDIEKYVHQTMEVEKTNYENLIESLQNNADVIEANRKEIEEQHLALIRAQQPEVVPEPQYVDSAFAENYTEEAQEAADSYEETQPVAYEDAAMNNTEEIPEEVSEEESFEYEEEEDDLFGE